MFKDAEEAMEYYASIADAGIDALLAGTHENFMLDRDYLMIAFDDKSGMRRTVLPDVDILLTRLAASSMPASQQIELLKEGTDQCVLDYVESLRQQEKLDLLIEQREELDETIGF
jgi:hypothetical protein